jgi:hypothetical protein
MCWFVAFMGCGPFDMMNETCRAESDAAFCARFERACGTVVNLDNCGARRTVLSCGTCAGTSDAGRQAPESDGGMSCSEPIRTPANLFPNGDFECGSTPPFQSSGGSGRVAFVQGRAGRALRFTVAPGLNNNEFATSPFRLEQAGTYCARAYVRGSATAIVLRLYVGPPGAALGEMFVVPGPKANWSKLPPTLNAVQVLARAGDEGLLVFADPNHGAGATIEVDDVDVWLSQDGLCRER